MDKLLSVNETMSILNISRQTIYRLIKQGKLLPIKIGRKTLFKEEDLKKFIEESRTIPPS